MSKRQPIDLGLTGFDELFMTEQERHANQLPRIYDIPIAEIDDFPFPAVLPDAKPVMEYMDGWKCDISGARKWEDLPEAAQKYVEYVEKAIGCPITYVSVGPERDAIILR